MAQIQVTDLTFSYDGSQRSGDYEVPGYYIVGDNAKEHYDDSETAMHALHNYRLK